MSRFLPLLLLCACAAPERPWHFEGDRPAGWDEELPLYVAAARQVTPDEKDRLKGGGVIYVHGTQEIIDAICLMENATGCAGYKQINLLYLPPRFGPALSSTALAHELCHLGLERGGGMFGGPLMIATEPQADACALLVHAAVQ